MAGRSMMSASVLIGLLTAMVPASPWPVVTPLSETYFSPDGRAAAVVLDIPGTDGSALYRLECHNWLYEGDRDFDYSGDFECRLTSRHSLDTYSTLLTDVTHPTRDWQSRARFRVSELIGSCASNLEYGLLRSFRLRGMRLVLELTNIELAKPPLDAASRPVLLKSFGFKVTVEQDASAASPITEPTNAPAPPAECQQGYVSEPASAK